MSDTLTPTLLADWVDVAFRVRNTVKRLEQVDPDAARDLLSKCDSVLLNLSDRDSWQSIGDAMDTVYGLCLMAEATLGPVH